MLKLEFIINKCVYYVYSQNTTILVRIGTVCINNNMFRPLYWPSSGLYSTLVILYGNAQREFNYVFWKGKGSSRYKTKKKMGYQN
jgi:hypothetical protein